ncbi:MAG: Gfo/Idh/MocA family oxidoreductase [Candidatus Omnitrophica bacterium]|nr:Gfo/Idh/MocA family oxidoreductase [Candidatus Omnitrophota bacterium]
MKNFKAAVIGLGFIGAGDDVSGKTIGQDVRNLDGTHACALSNYPYVILVAGSSRDPGRRQRFSERFPGVKTYESWKNLLESEKPDIVSIATNSPFHAGIGIACAEAKVKAIICEKPITTRLSDADRFIDVCRKNNVILAVNHTRRWHPLWRKCRDMLREGVIGEIYSGYAQWPTGRIGNIGTHIFDVLRMLLGSDPVAVSGNLDPLFYPDCRKQQYRDPGGWGIIEFSSDVRVFINAAQKAKLPLVVRIMGSQGELRISGKMANIENWDGNREQVTFISEGKTSLDRAVEDVVDCIEKEGKPACSGEDGLLALEVIIGFHVSHMQSGKWVELPIQKYRDLEVMIG